MKDFSNENAQYLKTQLEEANSMIKLLTIKSEQREREIIAYLEDLKQSVKSIEVAVINKATKNWQRKLEQCEEEEKDRDYEIIDLKAANRELVREKAFILKEKRALHKDFAKKWHAFKTRCTCAFSK